MNWSAPHGFFSLKCHAKDGEKDTRTREKKRGRTQKEEGSRKWSSGAAEL